MVSTIGINAVRHILKVSTASKIASLSSCMSLLYAKGNPFSMVSNVTTSPMTLPDLPRTNSAISGFFFCGIMLEPVEKASSSSTNLNSQEHHKIISSEKRDRCTIANAMAEAISTQKSRSATLSKLLLVTLEKPNNSAVMLRFNGYVVPANAPAPNGSSSIRALASFKRPRSRRNISA